MTDNKGEKNTSGRGQRDLRVRVKKGSPCD